MTTDTDTTADLAGRAFQVIYCAGGFLTFLWVWIGQALVLFTNGQMTECVVWALFLGPLVGGAVSCLWPIYWLALCGGLL